MSKKATLTSGPVGPMLFWLGLPMVGGIAAIHLFNLTDTYFISRLGTVELAAISFTIPVVLMVGFIALGLGMGAASVVSRIIGEGNQHEVRRTVTDSLVLAVLIVGMVATVGYLTIDPLFRLLGATDEVLPLIRQYMEVWYCFVAFMIIPMVANNIIRATGDTVTPSLIMMTAAVLNVILDPILIFGLLGAPELGIAGAAWATVIARFLTLIASLYVLIFKAKLIEFSVPTLSELTRSWKRVMHIALPTAGTNLLMPLSQTFFVWLAASYGTEAVAAVGTGFRVEGFTLIIPVAIGSTLIPFFGQNWGAKKYGRIKEARKLAILSAFVWGVISWLFCLCFSGFIARIFSSEPEVIKDIQLFLSIVFIGHCLQHVAVHATFMFNAVGSPLQAASVNIIRVFLLMVPLAFVLSLSMGLPGIFVGMAVGNMIAGIIAGIWTGKFFGRAAEREVVV